MYQLYRPVEMDKKEMMRIRRLFRCFLFLLNNFENSKNKINLCHLVIEILIKQNIYTYCMYYKMNS